MLTDEVAFLRGHKTELVERWARHVERAVSPTLFADEDFFPRAALGPLLDSIILAFESNLYRELNRAFDRLVDQGYLHGIDIRDAKQLLCSFPIVAQELLDQKYADDQGYQWMTHQLAAGRDSLKSVYAERVSAPLLAVVEEHRAAILRRWQIELPTPAVSPHFAVVSVEERREFVEATFGIYLRMLAGEEDRPAEARSEQEEQKTHLARYLSEVIPFFKERGFAISDVMAAMTRLEVIAEPLLYAAYEEDAAAYRKAKAALREVCGSLSSTFAEGYNRELMRDYYNEVSIMLHRIKNKLTAVPTSLQTILPQVYDGVPIDGDTLTAENARHLEQYEQLRSDCLSSTLALLRDANPESDDGAADLAAKVGELSEKYQGLTQFVQEHQEQIRALKRKLSTEAIERTEEFLTDALEGGELTTELTRELQEIQNELYNREPPVWEAIDLRETLQGAFDESLGEAKAKEIEYELDMTDGEVIVFGVRRQLIRPFAQVISNAVKYTPERGAIHVKLERTDGHALVSVKDTGIGIPEGQEDLVFELCQRCTNAQEQYREGSGTGLYHDRKTIRLHNGEMWVKSPGENQGSTFFIQLPIYTNRQA
ncbi:MAG: sensor histidine kinase [Armatimonadota bacterium]